MKKKEASFTISASKQTVFNSRKKESAFQTGACSHRPLSFTRLLLLQRLSLVGAPVRLLTFVSFLAFLNSVFTEFRNPFLPVLAPGLNLQLSLFKVRLEVPRQTLTSVALFSTQAADLLGVLLVAFNVLEQNPASLKSAAADVAAERFLRSDKLLLFI